MENTTLATGSELRGRICLVTEELSTAGQTGGIGGAFLELASLLAKHHLVDVLYCPLNLLSEEEQGLIRRDFKSRRINLRFLDESKYSWGERHPAMRSYAVYRTLQDSLADYDVVHFHDYKGLAFYSLAARDQGLAFEDTKFVMQCHGSSRWTREANQALFTHSEQIKIDFLEHDVLRRADYVVSPSAYLLDWMRERDVQLPPGDRSLVIKNVCTDLAELAGSGTLARNSKVNAGRASDFRELVFFGRHEFRKGFTTFCDALDLLNKVLLERKIQVTFLGKFGHVGEEHSGMLLAQRSRKWDFPISILPDHDRAMAAEYLTSTQQPLVVVPSPYENSPYTVLETIALGLPLITSDGGGGPELISEDVRDAITCAIEAETLAAKILSALEAGLPMPKLAEPLSSTEKQWLDFHQKLLLQPAKPKRQEPATLPKVTFAITHYERPTKLVEAISSVVRQTYPNLELIVVDDGSSSEKTLKALDEIEPMIKRFGGRLIRRKNGYLGAARNTAAAAATGEYLCFLDDDDIAFPHLVERLVTAAQNTGSHIVNCFNIFMPESRRNEIWPTPQDFEGKVSYHPLGGPFSIAPIENVLGAATALISRECFDKLGGYTELKGVGHEDYEFFLRAVQAGYRIEVCPEPLYLYEVDRPSMISSTSGMRNFKRVFDAIEFNSNPHAFEDLVNLMTGQVAHTVTINRRHHNLSKDKNRPLIDAIESTSNTDKLLAALSEYASAIGADSASRAFDRVRDFYLASEASKGDDGKAASPAKRVGLGRIASASQAKKDATSGDSASAGERAAILLEVPARSAKRLIERLGTSDYLPPELATDIAMIASQRHTLESATELYEALKGKQVLASNLSEVLPALFSLAIQAGADEEAKHLLEYMVSLGEAPYLALHRDVAAAVPANLASGFHHYMVFGAKEGRVGFREVNSANRYYNLHKNVEMSVQEFVRHVLEGEELVPLG